MKILAFVKEFIGLDPGPDFQKCGGRCHEVYCERPKDYGYPQRPDCRKAHDDYLRQRPQKKAKP